MVAPSGVLWCLGGGLIPLLAYRTLRAAERPPVFGVSASVALALLFEMVGVLTLTSAIWMRRPRSPGEGFG